MLWLEETSPSQAPAAKGLLLLPALHHKDRLTMQAESPPLLPSLRYCSAVDACCNVPTCLPLKPCCCLDLLPAFIEQAGALWLCRSAHQGEANGGEFCTQGDHHRTDMKD